jgi:hypothetical protein
MQNGLLLLVVGRETSLLPRVFQAKAGRIGERGQNSLLSTFKTARHESVLTCSSQRKNPVAVKEVLTAFSKLHLDKYRQANLLQNEDFETNQVGDR